MQPLDISVFGPLKKCFDQVATRSGVVRADMVVGKSKFSETLR